MLWGDLNYVQVYLIVMSENEKDPLVWTWVKLNRWSLFGLIVLTAIGTITYVNNVMNVNKLFANIRVLEKNFNTIEGENKRLKAELNNLQAPGRILKIAKEKLGMEKPERAPFIIKNK